MASQIAHIVYGNKVKIKFLKKNNIDEKKYFIGNVFPDIRYLRVISRDETHPKNPELEKLQKIDDPFKLGVYTHSFVDWEREKTLKRLGMYDEVENETITKTAMKLVEDEILYPYYNNWKALSSYLEAILPEEESLVPRNAILKWHNLLEQYFLRKMDAIGVMNLIGFENKVINAVIIKMEELRNNKKVMEIIKLTYFEIFKQY
jgi:hypothetical protein